MGDETHPRTIFAKVWSCFTTLTVAALGILVSSVISTLRTMTQEVFGQVITRPTAFLPPQGRKVHGVPARSSRPGINRSTPVKQSSEGKRGGGSGHKCDHVEVTDNKYMALKPASCKVRHKAEHSLGLWEKEEDLRSLPIHNPLVLSQRPIKTTDCKISRYVSPQVAKSISDACHCDCNADDIAIALGERADGMD